ncbi:MAG: tetratricopeptide repeat protein [Sedimentisphaerales bacterium]|nr:tetratricopeptide repeat protein [Sedimentisphaerales bacterium]
MLRDTYPQADFQVITAAMAAINSHVVLEIAKDCARRRPDLFIVYLGNNEVVGPYGAGTVFTPLSSSLALISLAIALKATRTGQLLTSLFDWAASRRNTPRVWGGMAMFLEKQVRADDSNLETVYRHFHRNLRDITRIAGKAIEVCREGLRYSPNSAVLHCNLGTLFAKQGRKEQALKEIQTALQIDPNSVGIRRILEAVSGKSD